MRTRVDEDGNKKVINCSTQSETKQTSSDIMVIKFQYKVLEYSNVQHEGEVCHLFTYYK